MNTLETSKKQIMRRVYFVWTLKTIFSATTTKIAAFAVLLWQLSVHVSIRQVFENWTYDSGISSGYAFIESAFLNTELTTQVLLAGMGVVAILLAKDMLRLSGRNLVSNASFRI